MVLLAKWLLEYDPNARVLIVTDRDELDKQISDVMQDTGVVSSSAPSPVLHHEIKWLKNLKQLRQGCCVP